MMVDQVTNLAKVESKLKAKHTIGYIVMVKHYIKCNGLIYTIKIIKQLKNYVERHSIKLEVEPISFMKSNKKGFPKKLRIYKRLINGSPERKRAVISLFKLVDNMTVDPVMDTTSVTSQFEGEISDDLIRYAASYSGLPMYSEVSKPFYLSSKAGPNGKATVRAIKDLEALNSDHNLKKAIISLLPEDKAR